MKLIPGLEVSQSLETIRLVIILLVYLYSFLKWVNFFLNVSALLF